MDLAKNILMSVLGLTNQPPSSESAMSEEEFRALLETIKNGLEGLLSAIGGVEEYLLPIKSVADGLIMSDIAEKCIQGLASRNDPFTEDDVMALAYLMGPQEGLDPRDIGTWNDDMVSKYAQHLKNYLYTYKDEATHVDPSIDPEEEHVGPMAQDIEQVAPDCVKETPEGVKVVDGDRLALVNAGVIGDLSREVIELRSRLAALEAKL